MTVSGLKPRPASSREVVAICDEDHCDDFDENTCPHFEHLGYVPGGHSGTVLQSAFDQHGPADERVFRLDWWRSEAEPWRTIAREMGVA